MRTKLGKAAAEDRNAQLLVWRRIQREASNQDELNEATEQINQLLDAMLATDLR
jgi:hypothetical protein